MRVAQQNAERLAAALCRRGLEAVSTGSGRCWKVYVTGAARTARVDCFGPRRDAGQRTGDAVYLVKLHGGEQAEGRTRDVAVLVDVLVAWLGGAALSAVIALGPFIGAGSRARDALASRLAPRLRKEGFGDPTYDLWVYGDKRSALLRQDRCSFFYGPQVFGSFDKGSPIDAVHAWVRDGVALLDLPSLGVVLGPHVEHIVDDPARWHWLNTLDRVHRGNHALHPLRPLLHRLHQSPVARCFYTHSSHDALCFSASSHFPWVGRFPSVLPTEHAAMVVLDGRTVPIEQATLEIEEALQGSPVPPFFGSKVDLELVRVQRALQELGSSLTAAGAARPLDPSGARAPGASGEGVRDAADGGGRCTLDGHHAHGAGSLGARPRLPGARGSAADDPA